MASSSALEGVGDLTRKLIALGKLDDGKVLKSAVRAGINVAYQEMLKRIPVGTQPHRLGKSGAAGIAQLVAPGYAKSQLKSITTINAEKNIASGITSVKKKAFYAIQFVDRGTRYQRPQKWFVPSFTDKRLQEEDAIRDVLLTAVLRAAKS